MKNRFYYYQLLDEREEQLFNKAGSESFYICIALSLLSYIISVLAPSLFNSNILLIVIIIGTFTFSIVPVIWERPTIVVFILRFWVVFS